MKTNKQMNNNNNKLKKQPTKPPKQQKNQTTVVKVYSLTTITYCQAISTNQLQLQRDVNLSVKHDLLFNLYWLHFHIKAATLWLAQREHTYIYRAFLCADIQILPAALAPGQRSPVRSLFSGESLWLLDARVKCSSERMEPRKIGMVLELKWIEYLSFMYNLCQAPWLLLRSSESYTNYIRNKGQKGNVWLRVTFRVCWRMEIYTLDLYFTGTLSNHQGFPSKSVAEGKSWLQIHLVSNLLKVSSYKEYINKARIRAFIPWEKREFKFHHLCRGRTVKRQLLLLFPRSYSLPRP